MRFNPIAKGQRTRVVERFNPYETALQKLSIAVPSAVPSSPGPLSAFYENPGFEDDPATMDPDLRVAQSETEPWSFKRIFRYPSELLGAGLERTSSFFVDNFFSNKCNNEKKGFTVEDLELLKAFREKLHKDTSYYKTTVEQGMEIEKIFDEKCAEFEAKLSRREGQTPENIRNYLKQIALNTAYAAAKFPELLSTLLEKYPTFSSVCVNSLGVAAIMMFTNLYMNVYSNPALQGMVTGNVGYDFTTGGKKTRIRKRRSSKKARRTRRRRT